MKLTWIVIQGLQFLIPCEVSRAESFKPHGGYVGNSMLGVRALQSSKPLYAERSIEHSTLRPHYKWVMSSISATQGPCGGTCSFLGGSHQWFSSAMPPTGWVGPTWRHLIMESPLEMGRCTKLWSYEVEEVGAPM